MEKPIGMNIKHDIPDDHLKTIENLHGLIKRLERANEHLALENHKLKKKLESWRDFE